MDNNDFEKIFISAVEKYTESLVKLAFTYTKNMYDAEDAVQNVFIKYYAKKPEFKSDEHLKAWLIRSVINQCKDFLKSSWYKSLFIKYDDLSETLAEMPHITSEDSELIEAVLSLRPNYKSVIHLFYFEGYSIKETAKILNISESAAAKRLSRARNMIKEKLEKGKMKNEKRRLQSSVQ